MDENTVKLLQAHQTALAASNTDPAPSEVQNSAVEAADATVHSEVPSGPTIKLADKLTNGCSADTTAQVCQEAVSAQVSGAQAQPRHHLLWVVLCFKQATTVLTVSGTRYELRHNQGYIDTHIYVSLGLRRFSCA